jgi:glycyl-tRNA synthetase beta chain
VREGNERVLRARLTDARFFFAEDRKVRLEARVERLGDKGLHRDLGSYLDKTVRVEALVKWLAEELDASEAVADALRAARLAKADLVTEMVGEFPELQGTVGRIYAGLDGERPEVGRAIEDHYRPRGPEDGLPRDMAGVLVALADKLDDLAAFFHVGGAPTGSSDPFGLRRQALGLLRIVTDRELPCPLDRALARAVALVAPGESGALAETILEYVKDRFYQSMTDEGFRYDLIRAALGAGFSDPADCRRRVRALTALAGEPDWPRLVEVVERTCNITRGLAPAAAVDPGRLVEEEERRLYAALERHEPEVLARLAADDYEGAARHFVDAFADPVHEFFLKVFVNVDDAAVRDNRIALLARVNGLFAARIADLTRVEKGPAT